MGEGRAHIPRRPSRHESKLLQSTVLSSACMVEHMATPVRSSVRLMDGSQLNRAVLPGRAFLAMQPSVHPSMRKGCS